MPSYTGQQTSRSASIAAESVATLDENYYSAEEGGTQVLSTRQNEPQGYDSIVPTKPVLFRPQSIVIDRSLVFPAEPPSSALYQLNHDLDLGNSVTIERIDRTTTESPGRSPRTSTRDKEIYAFSHRIFNDRFIEVVGKRKACFSRILMTKSSALVHPGWTISAASSSWSERGQAMLHCRRPSGLFGISDLAFRWVDGTGKTIATESQQVPRAKSEDGKKGSPARPETRHVLNVLEPLEQKAVDLLVTAWCARVWHDTLKAHKVLLTPNEGGIHPFYGKPDGSKSSGG